MGLKRLSLSALVVFLRVNLLVVVSPLEVVHDDVLVDVLKGGQVVLQNQLALLATDLLHLAISAEGIEKGNIYMQRSK